jgi:hypothetical protein
MSATATEPLSRGRIYSGVACVTAATLILELTLTRIFSVVMYYHFAFLAISLALFGLGLAGIYLYLRPRAARGPRFFPALKRYAIAAALTTVAALVFVLRQKVSLALGADNIVTLTLIYLVTATPFFFAGLCVTAVVNRLKEDMGRLYFYDLVGAGLGCLLLTLILSALGGINAVLLCAALYLGGGLLFESARGGGSGAPIWRWGPLGLLTVAALALIAVNAQQRLIRIPSVKGTHEERVIFARWNSFSRVTVEQSPRDYLWLKMDSSAATRIFSKKAERDNWAATRQFSETRVASLVYALARPGPALIIGPGGGADVIAALRSGAKRITGVELNPIIAEDVMKQHFRDYTGGLYLRPEVEVVADEGRSYIRSSSQRYDSIQATLVDTWAATAAGAFTLSENTLYTREAFRDYLEHLSPRGVLTMTRWTTRPPREFLRLLVLGRAALEDFGVAGDQQRRHFYVAADSRMATFLLKRTPLTAEEVEGLDRYVQQSGLRRLYSPFGDDRNPYAAFLEQADWQQRVAAAALDLSPPSDDRPFFFYTVKPAHALSVIDDWRRLTRDNLGLLILLILLGLVLSLVVLFFVLPLFVFRRDVLRGDRLGKARFLAYFVALGAGFITVEIALMQKFILFLGHPTYALVVVLFALLIFSGIGSYRCRNIAVERITATIVRNLLFLAGLVLLYLFLLSPLFDALVTLPRAVRIPLAVLLTAPLGLLMGTFLPLGIRASGERFGELVPWAWGLNGAASVFGSVLAIALAMNLGFNLALVVGLGFYLLGLVALGRLLVPVTPASS